MFELDYIRLVNGVIDRGNTRPSRVGPTYSVFGAALTIDDLKEDRFPLITQRQFFYKGVFGELAAFIRGATDLSIFKKFGCNYWDDNAAKWSANYMLTKDQHRVGNIYGAKWRNFNGVDQLRNLLDGLRKDPYSRRHLLTTHDPSEQWHCLPPCHLTAQFYCDKYNRLACCVYMRSVDLCLGLPSDIALYAALLILIAREVDLKPGALTFMFGDAHVYVQHVDTWKAQRKQHTFPLPRWELFPETDIFNFEPQQLEILNYKHGEKLGYQLFT